MQCSLHCSRGLARLRYRRLEIQNNDWVEIKPTPRPLLILKLQNSPAALQLSVHGSSLAVRHVKALDNLLGLRLALHHQRYAFCTALASDLSAVKSHGAAGDTHPHRFAFRCAPETWKVREAAFAPGGLPASTWHCRYCYHGFCQMHGKLIRPAGAAALRRETGILCTKRST